MSRRRETSSSSAVQVLAGRDALGCLCPVLPTRLGSTVESESRKKTWNTDKTKGRKASYTMILLNDIWCTMCIYFLIHMINHQFCHIFVELGYPGDIRRGKCWVVSVTVTGGTNTPGWLKHFGCRTCSF